MKKIIIAIDGTSSTGKSSVAKKLAEELNYTYIDTGAMYRAIALLAMRGNAISDDNVIDEVKLQELLSNAEVKFIVNPDTHHSDMFLNGENVERQIRSMEVSSKVSPIAAIPFVRQKMVALQQAMGKEGGIVMDGRDIGTVVFPQAEMKVFMTASPEVRAMRRFRELQAKGMPAPYEEILKNVQERDYIDSHRDVAPLKQAEDAYLLDNSNMVFGEEIPILMKLYNQKVK